MSCNCIDIMNESLAPYNSRLQLCHSFSPQATTVYIPTEKINTRARDKMGAIATYCPFCGTKYRQDAAVDAVAMERAL